MSIIEMEHGQFSLTEEFARDMHCF